MTTALSSVAEMERITIYMGSRCNLNCAYCHREKSGTEQPISDGLLSYVRGRSDIFIKFMGGEPTLYFDDIKRVVEAAPDASYAVSTNGVNLERYLPFFREHRFLVCISYDGSGDDTRGFDPFTKLIEYPWIAVSCTLYHGNTDFRRILANFVAKERIVGRKLSFFPHIVHHTGKHNEPFALMAEDFDDILRQYKECVSSFVADYKRGVVNSRYMGLFTQLARRYRQKFSFGETYCSNKSLRKVDATGQPYTCLYIRDEMLGNDTIEIQSQILEEKFPKCRYCSVYGMCGAACIKSISHEAECQFYKRLYTWFAEVYEENHLLLDKLEV